MNNKKLVWTRLFYSTLSFVFAKILVGYQFYFFYVFYTKRTNYMYYFLAFYFIERCISITVIHKILTLEKIDKFLITSLGVFSLDEFLLFLRSNQYPVYLESGIQGQSIVVYFASIPIQITCVYYSYQNPADIYAFYSILSFIFMIMCLILMFQAQYLDYYNNMNQHKIMLKIIYELSILSFKVLTTVSLIIVNMRSTVFTQFLKSFLFTLGIISFYNIKDRASFISKQKNIKLYLVYLKYFVCFLDLMIDLRQFKTHTSIYDLNKYGYAFYNRAHFSSICMKIFLFYYYITTGEDKQELLQTQYIIYVIGAFSIMVSCLRLFNYAILVDTFKPNRIEINSVEDLQYYCDNASKDKSRYENVQQVDLFHEEDKQYFQLYVQIIFSRFRQSEVNFQTFQKHNPSNLQKGYFAVELHKPVDLQIFFECLSKITIAPEIKEIIITNLDIDSQDIAKNLMIENNVFIYLKIYQICLNKRIVDQVNLTKIQIKAFNNFIYDQMVCNPKEVLYDLYS